MLKSVLKRGKPLMCVLFEMQLRKETDQCLVGECKRQDWWVIGVCVYTYKQVKIKKGTWSELCLIKCELTGRPWRKREYSFHNYYNTDTNHNRIQWLKLKKKKKNRAKFPKSFPVRESYTCLIIFFPTFEPINMWCMTEVSMSGVEGSLAGSYIFQ